MTILSTRSRALLFGLLLVALVLVPEVRAQDRPEDRRIIDVHLHALSPSFFPEEVHKKVGYERRESAEAVMRQTIRQLERFGVEKATTSGNPALLETYKQAAPDRIIRSLWIPMDIKGDSLRTYLDSLPRWHEQGRFQVIGEVLTQFSGITPDDSILAPLWSFAEREGVPVGIHINDSPNSCPDSLSEKCTPLAMTEVLDEHPNLKVYVMHAGIPHREDMIALLSSYPQVYVDATFTTRTEIFHSYLEGLVEAGFADRVMFGSDQMAWPERIGKFVTLIENADYLSEEQRRAIFYENAARFFGLESEGRGDS